MLLLALHPARCVGLAVLLPLVVLLAAARSAIYNIKLVPLLALLSIALVLLLLLLPHVLLLLLLLLVLLPLVMLPLVLLLALRAAAC